MSNKDKKSTIHKDIQNKILWNLSVLLVTHQKIKTGQFQLH